jgi:hypothetical protein
MVVFIYSQIGFVVYLKLTSQDIDMKKYALILNMLNGLDNQNENKYCFNSLLNCLILFV